MGWGWAGAGNSSVVVVVAVAVAAALPGAKRKSDRIPNLMGEQQPLKINPRRLKMGKWISSENVNLIAKIQYKVNISLKT